MTKILPFVASPLDFPTLVAAPLLVAFTACPSPLAVLVVVAVAADATVAVAEVVEVVLDDWEAVVVVVFVAEAVSDFWADDWRSWAKEYSLLLTVQETNDLKNQAHLSGLNWILILFFSAYFEILPWIHYTLQTNLT